MKKHTHAFIDREDILALRAARLEVGIVQHHPLMKVIHFPDGTVGFKSTRAGVAFSVACLVLSAVILGMAVFA